MTFFVRTYDMLIYKNAISFYTVHFFGHYGMINMAGNR